jgi:ring-1,2-phenylacetyl-CoA epoxidase subunit PaaC
MSDLEPRVRSALAELLLSMADDEFVLGFWDSEWTGIAPILEEDVAMSSVSQDEIGHAKALYEMLAALTDDNADRIAFGRPADAYRHAPLMNHPRTDWAFSVARRFLYENADAIRLEALARSSYTPLADLAVKMRREETYHLLHFDLWLRRLADGGPDARSRLIGAIDALWGDAQGVFAPLVGERDLLTAGILPESLDAMRLGWLARIAPLLEAAGLAVPSVSLPPTADARVRHTADFAWLHGEFTMVARSEAGAAW